MAGLMDEVNKAVNKIQETAKNVLDKTDIDEKIVGAAKDLKGKAQELLDKTDVDEKIVDAAKGLKDKAQEALDKTDVDEKIVDAAKGLKDNAEGLFKQAEPKAKDAMDQLTEEANAQFEKIRAAAKGTDPIHDFMNKKNAPAEEAEEPKE